MQSSTYFPVISLFDSVIPFFVTLEESTSEPTQEEGFVITTADSRPRGMSATNNYVMWYNLHVGGISVQLVHYAWSLM